MKATEKTNLSYSNIIAEIIYGCNFKTFLELGVDTGYTTKKILDTALNLDIVYCVDFRGEDIIKYESTNKHKVRYFFNTKTDDFFDKKIIDSIDCAFIDADHSYIQSRKDFFNCYNLIGDDGLIFLHDTYPPNIEMTHPSRNGDTYKLYEELSNVEWNDKIDIINLPIYDGLTIIRKRGNKKILTL